MGRLTPLSRNKGKRGKKMYTVSDIIQDISRGCIANNMQEDRFSYRIIFFVNEDSSSSKHYIDTSYGGIRKALENIIRGNLTLTNSVVIAGTTALMNGKSVCLQNRSYSFSLDGYFKQINGEGRDSYRNGVGRYSRCVAR